MNKIVLVSYLFTKFDDEKSLINFKTNYLKNEADYPHELLICFKLLSNDRIQELKQKIIDLKYKIFIDPEIKNDFDFGSYKRIAIKYPGREILFLNSHSYPICNKWLKKLMKYYDKNTLIGTSASNESIISSIRLKKKYKFISYFLKILNYKRKFKSFPNPHIRTSSFLINSNKFLDFMNDKLIKSKEDTWAIESGINGLTNYFRKRNLNIFVVNSDGTKFSENNWKLSETFNYLNQSKSIISDKHSRKYLSSSNDEKCIFELKTWGN